MKNSRNGKIALATLAIISVFGLIYLVSSVHEEKETYVDKVKNLESELQTRDEVYTEMMDVLYDVESQIENIKEREGIITTWSEGESQDGAAMVHDLKEIDSLMMQTNQRVSTLLSKLKDTEIDLTAFKRRVAKLSSDLEERKAMITELHSSLEFKDNAIAEYQYDIQNMEAVHEAQLEMLDIQVDSIIAMENKFNTGYVAIGSENELEERELTVKEGGFLGLLGRETELRDNADIENFTIVDVRETRRLMLDAKKVDLITNHPSNSFDLVKGNDMVEYLEIKDPNEFWKLSKYLVIVVKS